MDTKMIDALFLELAQFTKAQTPQMVRDAARIKRLESFISNVKERAALYKHEEISERWAKLEKDCNTILK